MSLPFEKSARRWILITATIILGLSISTGLVHSANSPATPARPDSAAKLHLSEAYGHLPMSFEANQGQADKWVDFLARGRGYSLFLTAAEAVLVLDKATDGSGAGKSPAGPRQPEAAKLVRGKEAAEQWVLRMQILGSLTERPAIGLDQLPGKSNYLVGNDPAQWKTSIPNYAKVAYRAIYPGVDLIYYGKQQRLEYDFVVAPGADPGTIRLGFAGADRVDIDEQGHLVLTTLLDDKVMFLAPQVYQMAKGAKEAVPGRYVLTARSPDKGAAGTTYEVGFEVGPYDTSRPLVIDPVLNYSTRFGGSSTERGLAIAVNPMNDNAYITGETSSNDFPGTLIAIVHGVSATGNVFVAKLNAAGDTLLYATYIGGTGNEGGTGIGIDSSGNAYVAGYTDSTNFPTALAEYDTNAGGVDAFVLKLNADGNALIYSSYLGGSNNDYAWDLDLYNITGTGWSAYIAGDTDSVDFPDNAGKMGAFAAQVVTSSALFTWTKVIGNDDATNAMGIAVDDSGNAYLTGVTGETSFPTTTGAYQTMRAGFQDGFVTKLTFTGDTAYSTYLGGSNYDTPAAIDVDADGNAYVTGTTYSDDFPITPGVTQEDLATSLEFMVDGFVTKLNSTGTGVVYSTYLGGGGPEDATAIAVDQCGNAHVTGYTDDPDGATPFPTVNHISGAGDCSNDAFVAKLNGLGTLLLYSTCLGSLVPGYDYNSGHGIALTGTDAFVTGEAASADFPGTNMGTGGIEAFAARLTHAGQSLGFFDFTFSEYEGAGSATITVSRYGGSSGDVTVEYETRDGTAEAAYDYVHTQGSLSWDDGDPLDKTFDILLLDDTLPEGDETINLMLRDPTGNAALRCATTATLTIQDTDGGHPGVLKFGPGLYEVDEDAGSALITVYRGTGSNDVVTVEYVTYDNTATAPDDYTATSGTLMWDDGDSTEKTFSVPVVADAQVEGDEEVNLRLRNPTGGAVLGLSNSYLIIHDTSVGTAGILEFNSSYYEVDEDDGSVVITVSRTSGSSGEVSIDYATGDDGADSPDDYATTSGTLTWGDGDSLDKTFTISVNTDGDIEDPETVNLILTNPTGGAATGRYASVLTIYDSTSVPAGILEFNADEYGPFWRMSDWTFNQQVRVRRRSGSGGEVSVNYATSDGTATAGDDYVATSGTLTWADGSTATKVITIEIIGKGDSVAPRETFFVNLSDATGGAVIAPLHQTAILILRPNGTSAGGGSGGSESGGCDCAVYDHSGRLSLESFLPFGLFVLALLWWRRMRLN